MAGGRRCPAGSYAQVVNLCGACLLMLLAGSTYSLSIFSPAMDALGGGAGGHPLAGVWSSALGLMSLVSAPAMLVAGLVISGAPAGGGSRSRLARRLSAGSALCFAGLAAAGAAAAGRSALALTAAVAAQGIALGVYYLLAVELLAAWAPRRRTGLATGVGMAAFGLGGMVFAAVFAALVRRLGGIRAVYATAALWAVPCALLTPWLSFPPLDDSHVHGTALPWSQLVTLHQFWLYMYICFVAQLGFGACLPWFFSTTGVFFDTPAAAAAAGLPLKFAIMNGVGIAARLAAGIAVDVLVVPGSRWLWSGAKNSLVLLMAAQTAVFLAMAAMGGGSAGGGFGAFFGALILLYCTFSAAAGNLAVLSREVFAPANGGAVFGVAAGLMMGIGEAASASAIAALNFAGRSAAAAGAVAPAALTADGVPRAAYNAFYVAAAAASGGALVATLVTHRVEAAFEVRLSDGTVGVLVDVTNLAAEVGADGTPADAAALAVPPLATDAVAGAAAAGAAATNGAAAVRPDATRPLLAVPGAALGMVDEDEEEDEEDDDEVDDDDFTLVSSYKAAFSLRDRVYVARPKLAPAPATYAQPSVLEEARGSRA